MADILPNFKEGLFLSDSSPWPTPKRPIPVCGMGLQSSPPPAKSMLGEVLQTPVFFSPVVQGPRDWSLPGAGQCAVSSMVFFRSSR